jgi:hypothetical protein
MIKALIKFRAKQIILLPLSLCMLLPTSVGAQSNDWWFEIEVILFKRKVDPEQLVETFKQDQSHLNIKGAVDLITPYIRPDVRAYRDALPYCAGDFDPEIIRPHPLFRATFPEIKLDEIPVDNTLASSSEPVNPTSETSRDIGQSDKDTIAEQDPDTLPEGELFTVNQNFLILPGEQSESQHTAWQASTILACVYPQEQQLLVNPLLAGWIHPEFIATVPGHINGVERLYANSAYLLASDSLELDYLYKEIKKQRDLTPLLHMGWRQEVKFGRSKADNIRLFAGHNYAHEYSASGEMLRNHDEEKSPPSSDGLLVPETDQLEQDTLYASIEAALRDNSPVSFALDEPNAAIVHNKDQDKLEQLWELDGLFKVYLQYINKVPYLHVESDLDYRAPVHISKQGGEEQIPTLQDQLQFHLQSYRLNQLRRVISKEVHYFDHPLFGAIVQIRRHQRPEIMDREVEPQSLEQAK